MDSRLQALDAAAASRHQGTWACPKNMMMGSACVHGIAIHDHAILSGACLSCRQCRRVTCSCRALETGIQKQNVWANQPEQRTGKGGWSSVKISIAASERLCQPLFRPEQQQSSNMNVSHRKATQCFIPCDIRPVSGSENNSTSQLHA